MKYGYGYRPVRRRDPIARSEVFRERVDRLADDLARVAKRLDAMEARYGGDAK